MGCGVSHDEGTTPASSKDSIDRELPRGSRDQQHGAADGTAARRYHGDTDDPHQLAWGRTRPSSSSMSSATTTTGGDDSTTQHPLIPGFSAPPPVEHHHEWSDFRSEQHQQHPPYHRQSPPLLPVPPPGPWQFGNGKSAIVLPDNLRGDGTGSEQQPQLQASMSPSSATHAETIADSWEARRRRRLSRLMRETAVAADLHHHQHQHPMSESLTSPPEALATSGHIPLMPSFDPIDDGFDDDAALALPSHLHPPPHVLFSPSVGPQQAPFSTITQFAQSIGHAQRRSLMRMGHDKAHRVLSWMRGQHVSPQLLPTTAQAGRSLSVCSLSSTTTSVSQEGPLLRFALPPALVAGVGGSRVSPTTSSPQMVAPLTPANLEALDHTFRIMRPSPLRSTFAAIPAALMPAGDSDDEGDGGGGGLAMGNGADAETMAGDVASSGIDSEDRSDCLM